MALSGEERANKIWQWSAIPKKLLYARLSNYEPATAEQKKAVAQCQDYADNCLERIDEGKGLFLYGPVGSGKSHLIVATFVEMLIQNAESFGTDKREEMFDDSQAWHEDWNGIICKFFNIPAFLENIRERYSKGTSEGLVLEAKNADIAIFDDIGADKPTDWVVDQLYRLIDYRYSNEKPTLFTSNCTIKELETRVGARTVSRIVGMTEGIKVVGPDYRKRNLLKAATVEVT